MKTYSTVHVIAQNKKGEILLLQRASHRSDPGTWNCITGYIQERESAEDTALRELVEETHLTGRLSEQASHFGQTMTRYDTSLSLHLLLLKMRLNLISMNMNLKHMHGCCPMIHA